MKKKLYSSNAYLRTYLGLAGIAVLIIYSYCIQFASLSWEFGTISMSMPSLSSQIEELDQALLEGQAKVYKIDTNTPTLVLRQDGFIFGKMQSFTEKVSDANNKYFVPLDEGRPDLSALINTMNLWMEHSKSKLSKDVLVFIPSDEIPMPIVIQIIYYLKDTGKFQNISLSTGLI